MQGEKLGGYRDIQTEDGGWDQDRSRGSAEKLKVELMESVDVSVRNPERSPGFCLEQLEVWGYFYLNWEDSKFGLGWTEISRSI